jgi:hypothetical protein
VIVELRDEDVGDEAGTGDTAIDRTGRSRHLDHRAANPAGLLRAGQFQDLELRLDVFDDLRDILADEPQLAAAFGAALAGVVDDPFVSIRLGPQEFTLWARLP